MFKRNLLAIFTLQVVLVNLYGFASGVKTDKGENCVFPFTYQGVVYNACTTKNHNRPWCSTTAVYSGKWGNCATTPAPTPAPTLAPTPAPTEPPSGVKTTKGEDCVFPFTYQGVVYRGCTTKNHNRPWCSTTAVYSGKWGNCATGGYKAVGCFKDTISDRALPVHIGNFDPERLVQKCYEAAKAKGYKVFGTQYKVECWSGPNGKETYNKNGNADTCVDGIGRVLSNFVYEIY